MAGLISHAQKFYKRNATTILTCIGGVGVVLTAVTEVKATPKALELLDEAKNEKGEGWNPERAFYEKTRKVSKHKR